MPYAGPRLQIVALLLTCSLTMSACAQDDTNVDDWTPRVVASYAHDPRAYTQGLVVYNGYLYEGTGQYGASTLRQVEIETGRVERLVPLNRLYFGEGITIFDDRIYQLTWKQGIGIIYGVAEFDVIETFRYAGEGWGLTHDGTTLIMSDGTPVLRFLDPETLAVVRTLPVRFDGRAVDDLNELEYIEGEVWANVWYDDRIARISPESGEVLGWIDLSTLHPPSERNSRDDVLNGIAYDEANRRVFVTGKNWPQLFELEFAPLR
jgi:glutamine cyclotransferase